MLATTSMMRPHILLIAMDNWYGGPRLPTALSQAGFEVGLLCTPDNNAAKSRGVQRRFPILSDGNWQTIDEALWRVLDDFSPDLIVPTDERAVRMLRRLGRSAEDRGSSALRKSLERSLPTKLSIAGRASMHGIAEQAGLTCPAYASVRSPGKVIAFARKHGWPVYLKRDNTAGGSGVSLCDNEKDVMKAFAQRTNTNNPLRSPAQALRRVRQFFRSLGIGNDPGMSVEAAVTGRPAFHTAVALDGRWLAGISAEVEAFHPPPNGPSTRVRLQRDPVMEKQAAALIARLSYNGFCGLDFIRQPDGSLVFLEFNARPTPTAHLGGLIGCDLAAVLFAELTDDRTLVLPDAPPARRVALFPQDWLRDLRADRTELYCDIPHDDDALVAALSAGLPGGWQEQDRGLHATDPKA